MKLSQVLGALALCTSAHAHAIFQQLSVNGKSAGPLVGLRAPATNNPVQDVTSASLVCGEPGSVSAVVVDVAPGDRLGAYFQHVLGGAQFPGDPDNPIAASHKGPVTAYLARVDHVDASHQGLRWFKIAQDAFDEATRTWGVDRLIANDGWAFFALPTCIAPGEYLLRVELLALHGAGSTGGAQFYTSCAQLRVAGSGSGSFAPTASQLVSFPGAYKANDPGILVNIYGNTGKPDMGGRPYTAPGPAVITC